MSTQNPPVDARVGGGARALTVADFKGDARRLRKEAAIRALFFSAAAISVLISALIILALVREAWTFITGIPLSTLTDTGWFPRRGKFDIGTLVVGTFIVSGVAMVFATPIGLGAAVYLSEYAGSRTRRLLKPIIEVLAGIPSVVLGFFALQWISPNLVQRLFSDAQQFNLLAAGIGVGILTVPLMASISEDALRSVPRDLREASSGLGAKKRTTTIRVVIPAAVSGLVAAFIVAVSRAVGETMVVAVAAGASGGGTFTTSPTEPGQTMTAAMAALAAGTDNVRTTSASGGDAASFAFQSLFFVGLLLFVVTLLLNLVADRFVRRVRQKY